MKVRKIKRRRQAQGLARMIAATERLGLYDAELEGLPRRSKPNAATRRAISYALSGRTTPVALDEL